MLITFFRLIQPAPDLSLPNPSFTSRIVNTPIPVFFPVFA